LPTSWSDAYRAHTGNKTISSVDYFELTIDEMNEYIDYKNSRAVYQCQIDYYDYQGIKIKVRGDEAKV
jgi:hypothetical protein